MNKLKTLPRFKSEAEEAEFWSTHDSTEYIDYGAAKKIALPNLKPSLKTISLRLPESLIAHLKMLANKRDVPYQSLLKIYLAEKIDEELRSAV